MKKPPSAFLYVADIIRVDASGKPDFLGCYPGNVLQINLPSEMPDPTKQAPYTIPSLAFFVWVKDSGVGSLNSFQVFAPTGESYGEATAPIETPIGLPANNKKGGVHALIQMQAGFLYVGFGEYIVQVEFEKHTYRLPFTIQRGELLA